jgi:hypothetical protein
MKRGLLVVCTVLLILAAWFLIDNIQKRREADRAVRTALVGLETGFKDADRLMIEAKVAIDELPEWQQGRFESRLLRAVKLQFSKERAAADERSALMSLRTISTACITYDAAYRHGYPAELHHMAPPAAGSPPSPGAAGLIDEVLASGTKIGYRYTYTAGAKQDGRIRNYKLQASPINWGQDGAISLYTDESGVIRSTRANRPALENGAPVLESDFEM